MDQDQVRALLTKLRRGSIGVAEALEQLSRLQIGDLGFAKIDHQRSLRRGIPEVVFAQGKSFEQLRTIVAHHIERKDPLVVTRLDPDDADKLTALFPKTEHDPLARTLRVRPTGRQKKPKPGLLIVTAGTSDLPVAREAAVCAEAFGLKVEELFDVGVAGLHRLTDKLDVLRAARVLIVVAGMEGALASVVAGLVSAPVIGVPTSAGYGVAAGGFAALASMLSSCAGGLTVVNVDNGFGAACAAHQILELRR